MILFILFTINMGLFAEIPDANFVLNVAKKEFKEEQLKQKRNEQLLKSIEAELLLKEDSCVRESLTVLRSVSKVYVWIYDYKISLFKANNLRLKTLNALKRLQQANILFKQSYYALQQCKLERSNKSLSQKIK